MEEKKKRGSNYTTAEKDILLELIKKYKDIIENKETNAPMITKKRDAWDSVCQQYNAVAVSGSRTWQQLRHLYENLKQRLRKNIAKANRSQFYEKTKEIEKKASLDKKQINCTGGGSYKSTLTEHETQILALSAPQIIPLSNPYDDAAVYFGDVEVDSNGSESGIAPSSDIVIIDDHHATTTNLSVSIPCTETPDIPDGKEALVAVGSTGKTKRPQTSAKFTGVRPKQNNSIKQQYFRTKLRNAKLENKYLINLNKMVINKYKIEMQILNLKLNKMKSTTRR